MTETPFFDTLLEEKTSEGVDTTPITDPRPKWTIEAAQERIEPEIRVHMAELEGLPSPS